MAGCDKYDVDQLIAAFREFSTDSKCMTNQECGKLVKNSLGVKMSNEGDIAFSKVKTQGKKTMDLDGKTVGKFMELMAQDYERKKQPNPDKLDTQTLLANKIIEKKGTAKAAAAKTSKTGGVDRLTDASKYTGSHKERFDESGKGKGKEGRVEEAKNDGYVGAYKGSGSYDKK